MKDFKYTAKFSNNAVINVGKWKEAVANAQIFHASTLDDLRSVLPKDEEIDDNPDLLYSSFNAAVVNLINLNDHGMMTDTALAVARYFRHKHMNIEHDKYDIVGHIINYGFSSFQNNKLMSEDELTGTTEPFNIVLGSVVYRSARQWFAEILEESSNPASSLYHEVSASWEVAFNDFDIAIGSKKLKDAEIISDPKQIAEMAKYLRMEGGEGFMPDGTPVYCVIKGSDVRPTGCAFTGNPAAAVKGVYVAKPQPEQAKKNQQSSEELTMAITDLAHRVAAAAESKSKEIEEKITKNSSQEQKLTVNTNTMNIKDITTEWLKTAEASVVRDLITDEVAKTASEYSEKLSAKEEAFKALEASKQDLEKQVTESATKVEELEAKVKESSAKVEELATEIAKRDKQEVFDARMEAISAQFELTEAQQKVVAAQIADLSDEEYSQWEDQFKVILPKKEAAASNEEEATASLKNTTEEKGTVVPNASAPQEDSKTKLLKTLQSVVKISN